MTEDGEEEEHKANLNQCLFCNNMSPSLDLNITHMSRQHGFFIPERDFLVDLLGLVNYLSETIAMLHTCLSCHRGLHTTSGIQTHMRNCGHCMIAYSSEEEQMDIGEFYDFRSTYSDEDSEDEEEQVNGGVSLGVKRAVKTTVQGEDGEDVVMEDDEGWESDSTLSSVPIDEIVYHDEFELHLPSGCTPGHRSLRKYYQQNLRNYPSVEERAEQQRTIEAGRHDSDADDEEAADSNRNVRGRDRQVVTRANGGMGMIGVSERTKQQVKAIEKRDLKKQLRAQNRYQAGNEKQNNFQKHFKDPLLQ
ncbi:pre-60S factor rei1 [Elasticomyces elasticus]|nr:pre-60S factor rei1 [Elasticomyces elasticus]